jgi:RNA polymerase sigma-70 factor, ECF subfamily
MNDAAQIPGAARLHQSTKTPQPSGAGVRGGETATVEDLVSRARAGDTRAFECLLAEARPRALSVAMKVLHNPDDAEDAVQDAFVKAWRNLHRFEGRSAFSTWIHRIVMNSSLDQLRRQACRPGATASSADGELDRRAEDEHPVETPERTLERTEVRAMVRGALAELSPSHRDVITLRELEEHSYEEIAQIAACPIGTVMSRLHHARKKIAAELRLITDTDDQLLPLAA